MRLTEHDKQGNWCVRGIPWEQLRAGSTLTNKTAELLYGALWKLKDYEDTGLKLEEILELKEFAENLPALATAVPTPVTVPEWIPVEEGMPEERDSIFAKFKGTSMWSDAMFEKISDDVNVTILFDDGTRRTIVSHTTDGKWRRDHMMKRGTVVAWMPLPEPYKGGEAKHEID